MHDRQTIFVGGFIFSNVASHLAVRQSRAIREGRERRDRQSLMRNLILSKPTETKAPVAIPSTMIIWIIERHISLRK